MKRLILSLALLLLLAAPSLAGSPRFPWRSSNAPTIHREQARPVGTVPVQALGRPATAPVEMLQPKQAYPYGWFGPKPEIHFHRSFGSSKAYTQWAQE